MVIDLLPVLERACSGDRSDATNGRRSPITPPPRYSFPHFYVCSDVLAFALPGGSNGRFSNAPFLRDAGNGSAAATFAMPFSSVASRTFALTERKSMYEAMTTPRTPKRSKTFTVKLGTGALLVATLAAYGTPGGQAWASTSTARSN